MEYNIVGLGQISTNVSGLCLAKLNGAYILPDHLDRMNKDALILTPNNIKLQLMIDECINQVLH